jgi:DNA-binding Lrp family transcriptional regulator
MSVNVKNIDLNIIKELLIDGRQSHAKIARKYNTSKEIIRNHYEAMKKDGVIVGSTIRNCNLIYDRELMVFFIVKIEQQKLEFVVEKISKIPEVNSTMQLLIKQRAIVFATLTDYNEVNKIKSQIRELPFVEKVDTEILIAVKTTPHNLSIFGDNKEIHNNGITEQKKDKTSKKIKIDETDKQIIEQLAINGRTAFSRIAKEIGSSTDQVIKRYKRLVKNNLIRVTVQINPLKLGYNAFGVFSLTFSKNNLIESLKYIKNIKNINLLIQSMGQHDLYLYIMIKDIDEFLNETKEIMKIPGIINAECDITKLFEVWPPREIFMQSSIF